MATLVRCPNNHFYNADEYSSCPYCEGNQSYSTGSYGENTVPIDYSSAFPDVTDSPKNEPAPGFIPETDSIPRTDPVKIDPAPRKIEDFDKTVGVAVWSDEKEEKTENSRTNVRIEPVVGWLVCRKGPEFGKSYTLKAGRNFIGRSDENDVVIRGDKGISRKEHGIVVYDPKARRFHVQPGSSSELFYVNDNVILQVMELNDRDVISLGETEMIFVALCGDDFSWNDLK